MLVRHIKPARDNEMTEISKPNYLALARKLSKEEAERLFSRMTGKLPRRLQKDKLSKIEALAIQLELEDERLQEWRKMVQHLRKKEKAKAARKAAAKTEAGEKKEAGTKKDAAAKKLQRRLNPQSAAKPRPSRKNSQGNSK